jgi:hypothetical protein
MNRRWLVLGSALLLLFAQGADAGGGIYERTKDGETLVWDNYPTRGESAEWSGKRDKDGYATGQGTLTWSKAKRSIFPFAKKREPVLIGRYSGKMVRGKFEGPVVNVDASGKTTHTTFVGGDRSGDWTVGPAAGPSRTGVAQDRQGDETRDRGAVAKTPAKRPPPVARQPPPPSSGATRPAGENVSPPAKETATPVNDSSLSIVAPPSLHLSGRASPQASIPPTPSSSPAAGPRLAAADVVGLADSEARMSGHDLGRYQDPRAEFNAANGMWSVSYDLKVADGAGEGSQHFSVSVDDKTMKTSVVPGK